MEPAGRIARVMVSRGDDTVCIVSHDAGGAELLACYARQNSLRARLVLQGPALSVFERHFGPVRSEPLEDAIVGSDWCLFGTSWQSDLEWQAIGTARKNGKRVVTFLDHWVNYRERFIRNGVERLPDQIWVGDEDAFAIARRLFPGLAVRLEPNPYFAYVRAEVGRYRHQRRNDRHRTALFVCENISGHGELRFGNARRWGYTEFDAIEYFFARLDDLGVKLDRVVLRPHPSDAADKYRRIVAAHAPLAVLSTGKPLLEEIAEADIVVGCESTALVAALDAGKRVLSSIPPGGTAQFIHHRRGIEMLRDLQPA